MKILILLITMFIVSCNSSTGPAVETIPSGDAEDLTRITIVNTHPFEETPERFVNSVTIKNFNSTPLAIYEYNLQTKVLKYYSVYNRTPQLKSGSSIQVPFYISPEIKNFGGTIYLYKGKKLIQTVELPALNENEVYVVPN